MSPFWKRRGAAPYICAVITLGACGDDGDGEPDPCDALCECIVENGGGSDARSPCLEECTQRRAEGAMAAECRTEASAKGYSQCAYTCSAFDRETWSSDGEGTGSTGNTGSTGSTTPTCSGAGCPESASNRQACHTDCDYSGYCWDVCENVTDYNVDASICSDGLDNDSDGSVDCNDPDCAAGAAICTGGTSGGTGGTSGDAGVASDGGSLACVADLMAEGRSEACGSCLCTSCARELSVCDSSTNASWAAQCLEVLDCCQDAGSVTGTDCYVAGCSAEIDAAGGGSSAVQSGSCTPGAGPPSNACQAAVRVGECAIANCPACAESY